MSQFDIRKWRNQLNESTGQNKRMSEQEKKETLESVSRFNELGKNIYKTQEISELVENIKTMAENASKMAIEETADWFDAVSVKRDTKAIGESIKVFEGTFREISTLQQRLESVFEEIGGKLGKYYEIKELVEDHEEGHEEEAPVEESEAQEKYQKLFKALLSKFGVDSPADLDDEKKKEFFNLVDKKHKGANENKFSNKFQKQVNEAYKKLNKVVRK
jgi:glycerophosphoryl diester phosphodiesterase